MIRRYLIAGLSALALAGVAFPSAAQIGIDPVARGLALSAVKRGNVTDCSSVASLCLNLQNPVGTTVFSVDKTGGASPATIVLNQGTVGAAANMWWSTNALNLAPTGKLEWNLDTILTRDAANTLAQRNGVNAQAFNIYNTFTDASNYEDGQLAWNSSVFVVGTSRAGTGTSRTTQLQGQTLTFFTAGTQRFTMDALGHLITLGTAPAITSCGTSPSVVTGTDVAGEFTTGTATPTSCTLTFNQTWTAAPHCTASDMTAMATLTSYAVTTTTIVFTTSAASSQKIAYHCIQG